MRCSFLQETRVRHCRAAPGHTQVRHANERVVADKCATPAHKDCTGAPALSPSDRDREVCPLLSELVVQSCAAAEVAKYVPKTETPISRCNSDAHRYCHVYLNQLGPQSRPSAEDRGVELAPERDYATNHLWLDASGDGSLHVGIDGLLARVLGRVDGVKFVGGRGPQRPAAVVRIGSRELPIIFPNRLPLHAVNVRLRTEPNLLCDDPYGSGWLFEGYDSAVRERGASTSMARVGLLRGSEASAWMAEDFDRVSLLVHRLVESRSTGRESTMLDGGAFVRGVAHHLGESELHQLYGEVFAVGRVPTT